MVDSKQSTDSANTSAAVGTGPLSSNTPSPASSAPLQDGVGTPMKGSEKPPMKTGAR